MGRGAKGQLSKGGAMVGNPSSVLMQPKPRTLSSRLSHSKAGTGPQWPSSGEGSHPETRPVCAQSGVLLATALSTPW